MRLYLSGHNCRYAVEQAMMNLFPSERPEYPEGKPSGERCEVRISYAEKMMSCSCLLVKADGSFRGRASVLNSRTIDKDSQAHHMSRIVKLAFYRAAIASGVKKPEWGCLTGVRPAKLMSAYLREGMSPAAARGRFTREYFTSDSRSGLCLSASLASERTAENLEPGDVCLYIGIPFCPTRCYYCSFVSQSVEKSMKLIEPYMQALLLDIDATAKAVHSAGLRPVAMYIGGGTPTTLSAKQLDLLCTRLAASFDFSAIREYTVEAGRPDTITWEKLGILRSHGVDRISVNPQTMSDAVLERIGRRHTAQDIIDSLKLVRRIPGLAVNMDLIAGLTSDSPLGFSRTLDEALALEPENITVHTLSIKKGSRLKTEGGELTSPEAVGQMLKEVMNRFPEEGYEPYYLYRQKFMSGNFENVGWTKPGYDSIYNICIMEELCSIISMGAGGSTKLLAPGKIKKIFAPKYPLEYINSVTNICAGKERMEGLYGI